MKGFREFIMQGNVVDMAVGIVIGAAFGAVVTALVDGFVNPLVQVFTGGGEVGGKFVVNGVSFNYGAFISALIYFLLVAAVIYFLIVLPINKLRERAQRGEVPVEPTEDVVLLREIRDEIKEQRQGSA